MSEDKGSSTPDQNDSNQDGNNFVPRKAYEEVTDHMHKYKSELRDMKAMINQLQAEKEAKEKESMIEKEQYRELYERAEQEKQGILEDVQKQKKMYLDTVKKSALKAELGNIKDAYLSFADLGSISFNDNGAVDKASLEAVANQFRSEYPELLPKSGQSNITSVPAGSVSEQSGEKPLSEMTREEKYAELKKLGIR